MSRPGQDWAEPGESERAVLPFSGVTDGRTQRSLWAVLVQAPRFLFSPGGSHWQSVTRRVECFPKWRKSVLVSLVCPWDFQYGIGRSRKKNLLVGCLTFKFV